MQESDGTDPYLIEDASGVKFVGLITDGSERASLSAPFTSGPSAPERSRFAAPTPSSKLSGEISDSRASSG